MGGSVIALMIALGVAMDDTIHFLARYRLESRTAPSIDLAVVHTFLFAGRAITIILHLGFRPTVASEDSVITDWGTDAGLAVVVALLAGFMVIPAVSRVGWIRFPMPK